jgi:hypothetical protein
MSTDQPPLTKTVMLWRMLDMWTSRVRAGGGPYALGGQLAAVEALWICDDHRWGGIRQILLEADRRAEQESEQKAQSDDDQRTVTFGRLTIEGEPLAPAGTWVLAEKHGVRLTSFIVLDDAEARSLRDQLNADLG